VGGEEEKLGERNRERRKEEEEKNQGKTEEENVTEAERSIGQLTQEHQPRLRLHHPPEHTDRRAEQSGRKNREITEGRLKRKQG